MADLYAATTRRLADAATFTNSPRFGHTNQFSDLFDDDTAPDYIVGIVISALILACAFLCWFIFILILKCMGKNRVGFLSGAPYDVTINGQVSSRPKAGRIVFGLSGLVYIIFTFILLFKGLAGLETTTDELSRGAGLGAEIFTDAGTLLGKFLEFAIQAKELKDNVVNALEDVFEIADNVAGNNGTAFLPGNENGTILAIEGDPLEGMLDENKFVFDDIDLKKEATTVVDELEKLGGMFQENAGELESLVREGEDTCTDVSDGLSDVQVRNLQIFFGIPFTIIPFFMLLLMGATWMGMGDQNSCKNCWTAWVVTPLFILFTLFLIVLTMAFSIAGIVNGDFCSGGEQQTPEETLKQIMNNAGVDRTSLKYQTINYLVNGCDITTADLEDGKNPLEVYDGFVLELENATATIDFLDEKIQEIGVAEVARRLATNMTAVEEAYDSLGDKATEMFQTMGQVLEDIACIRMYEIYEAVVKDATCTASYDGVMWIFISFLLMGVSGMTMITFRSVLYPLAKVDDSDGYSWNQAKEQEANNQEANNQDAPMNEEGPVEGEMEGYTVQTGLESGAPTNNIEYDDEPPVGGSASAAYQAVGDDNPFEESHS